MRSTSHRSTWRTFVSAVGCAALATLVSPRVVAQSTPPQELASPPAERNALDACIAVTDPNNPGIDRSALPPQLRRSDNRIEAQDFSGQDLAGRSFRGKVLRDVKLSSANLRGADFADAIICRSDLSKTDLTGAHLDRALIGGDTDLNGADLTGASARAIGIADAQGTVRVDGADLRGANIMCDADENVGCMAMGVDFASMVRADLRGATIDYLCCRSRGIETAQLDGMTTRFLRVEDLDFRRLATGAGASGRMTLIAEHGYSGTRTEFSGAELRRLERIVRRMKPGSAHPSFDCARAATGVEKALCAEPKLAALDRALDWLWRRVERSPQQVAAQRTWLKARAKCPLPDEEPRGPGLYLVEQECIGRAYAERIIQLAPMTSSVAIASGRYTTDEPLELPRDRDAALAEKYVTARGFRQDEIRVENLQDGAGRISGYGTWANGHLCGFDAPAEDPMERTGSLFRIVDSFMPPPDERYSISFVVTPYVVIRAGGSSQFQCGARGGWSEVYFRQPDNLIARVKSLHDPQ